MKKRHFLLLTIFLVLVVSWGKAWSFSRDGAVFLSLAKLLQQDRWDLVIWHPQHPLLPSGIYFLNQCGIGLEMAGRLISLGAACVMLLSLMSIIQRHLGKQAGMLAGFLTLMNPSFLDRASDILSDPLLWAGVLAGANFLDRALTLNTKTRDSKLRDSLLAGTFFGLGYLSRPEGFVFLGIFFLWALFRTFKHRLPASLPWLLLLGFLLAALPHVMALHSATGEWRLSLKVNYFQMSGLDRFVDAHAGGQETLKLPGFDPNNTTDAYAEAPNKAVHALSNTLGKLCETLWWPFLILVLYAVAKKRKLLAVTPLWILIFFQALMALKQWTDDHYLSSRHVLLSGLTLSVLAGATLHDLFFKLAKRWKIGLVILFALIAIEKNICLRKGREGRYDTHKIELRGIGQKLATQSATHLVCSDLRLAWFAGKHHVDWPENEHPLKYLERLVFDAGVTSHLVAINKRRPHRKLSLKKLDKAMQVAGYTKIEEGRHWRVYSIQLALR